MSSIKTYQNVNRADPLKSFGISRTEDIYDKHGGKADAPHRHDFYTVILCIEAKGQHIVDFKEYDLGERQVYFIGPGQVHQIIEVDRPQGFAMVFSADFLGENNIPLRFIDDLNLFRDYGESPPLVVDESQLDKLRHYCQEIFAYYHGQDKFKEKAIAALVELFLINCNNLCSLPFDNTQSLEAGNSILRGFKDLVEEKYKVWHASSQYAEALHISPDHLNRSIKSLIGKTAKEYIQSRITTAAKRMLYFSELSNKEIGFELGFSEPANFSAFFKKCTGISPSQFRKQA